MKGLKRPSVAAGAINLAVREHGADDLLAAGEELRSAHGALLEGSGDAAAVRDATAREREAVRDLTRLALGDDASAATEEKVRATLHAASVDDDVRELLEAGRLEREAEAGVDAMALMASASGSRRRNPPAAPKSSGRSAGRRNPPAARSPGRRREGERRLVRRSPPARRSLVRPLRGRAAAGGGRGARPRGGGSGGRRLGRGRRGRRARPLGARGGRGGGAQGPRGRRGPRGAGAPGPPRGQGGRGRRRAPPHRGPPSGQDRRITRVAPFRRSRPPTGLEIDEMRPTDA